MSIGVDLRFHGPWNRVAEVANQSETQNGQ